MFPTAVSECAGVFTLMPLSIKINICVVPSPVLSKILSDWKRMDWGERSSLGSLSQAAERLTIVG